MKKKTQRKPEANDVYDDDSNDNYDEVDNTTSNLGVNDDNHESADKTGEEAKTRAN